MRLLNIHNQQPNVVVACEFVPYECDLVTHYIEHDILDKPSNLDIITLDCGNTSNSLLIQQLKHNSIDYYNGAPTEGFDFLYKIDYIVEALSKTTAEYVMYLDPLYVKILTFDGIIDRFKKYDSDIVFCGMSEELFGNQITTEYEKKIIKKHPMSSILSTTAFIGKRNELFSFFKKMQKLRNKLGHDRFKTNLYYGEIVNRGDQHQIRNYLVFFKNIAIDYNQSMFLNIYNNSIIYIDERTVKCINNPVQRKFFYEMLQTKQIN